MLKHLSSQVSQWSVPLRLFAGCIGFSIFGTVVTKVAHLNPGPIPVVASLCTMFTGVWALHHSLKSIPALVWTLVLGASSELIGLQTGVPFGSYAYTSRWQPVIELAPNLYFPVQLPFAWFLIVGGAWLCFSHLRGSAGIFAAAFFATVIDFGMEEVMVRRLQYWNWKTATFLPGGAAFLNPLGWFLVSAVGASILRRYCKDTISESTNEGPLVLFLYLLLMVVLWLF